ncbi:unnamed protein product [Closterium sp. Yama58-4]|nr:unnamed protein product [Closterium sp. Yama58-4]
MEFPRQGLTGHLPLDVSKLTSLTKIDLQRNLIIERLDVFIEPLEGLTNLQYLDLSSNFLFGSIQPSVTAAFPRLTALRFNLDKHRCQKKSGGVCVIGNHGAGLQVSGSRESHLASRLSSSTITEMLKTLLELLTASKAGVLSFHVPPAEAEVVQCLCEGEATTCVATSAANPVTSPASVACVLEEERAAAALRATAEARITVARGTIPPGVGVRLPAAGAPPPVVAGAPPPAAAGALPRTGAAEADLPRASAARLLGPRAVTTRLTPSDDAPLRVPQAEPLSSPPPEPQPQLGNGGTSGRASVMESCARVLKDDTVTRLWSCFLTWISEGSGVP